MLPVRDAGQQDLVEIAEHCLKRLRLFGRRGRQPRPDVPRPHLSQHGKLTDALEIVGRPVDRAMPVLPERHFLLLTLDHGRVLTI